MNVCVIIPSYNESKHLAGVLSKLLQTNFDIIVVDDGSSDETSKVVKQFPVKLLSHYVNLGQGAALKTGTELAKKLGYSIIAHFDADGQHRVEDLQRIIKELNENDYDIVLGSRFLGINSDLSVQKKIILKLAKIFTRALLKLNFTDPQIGLRAFKSEIADKLDWQKNDFQHATEILGLIIKNKLKYKEIPIKVAYNESVASKTIKPQARMGFKLILNKIFG